MNGIHPHFIQDVIISHYESMIPTATVKHLIFINQRLEFLIAQKLTLWN
jgi:hypothetical protein